MNKTELIASQKPVISKGKDMIIVTTTLGNQVWVPKEQMDASAEQITYTPRKKGDKYINKDGTEGALKDDRNDYVGTSKQIVRKYSTIEVLDHLASKGVTPTFAL